MTNTPDTYAGFIAMVGLPNAGKSSLINAMLNRKVSIVSRKRQTTRMPIMAALSQGQHQLIFVDTPGVFNPKGKFEKAIAQSIEQGIRDADTLVLIIDARRRDCFEANRALVDDLNQKNKPVVVLLNKSDLLKQDELLPIIKQFKDKLPESEIIVTSTVSKVGLDLFLEVLKEKIPPSPWFYDETCSISLSEKIQASELTREQIFDLIHEEIPYQVFVETDKLTQTNKNELIIYQTIYVQHKRHVGMFLGTKGQTIKLINQRARQEMCNVFGKPCHLYLHVKVDPNWQTKSFFYRAIGLKG
ncbi:MAG: GTPase Era [Alphaproteobacteria bacterium]|nr:MAG: GTPase Era [Alphaproteobacteria bacterium]